jgi:flavin reductase (DIM6/NTAB) family NADH-FMN oxidoreductase RutF
MNDLLHRIATLPGGQDLAVMFRQGMSRVGAGVHVLATDGPSGRAGLTATAMTSVSDTPPTLLACVKATGRFALALKDNELFSVNTLADGQVDVAEAFAGRTGLRGDARFDVGVWRARQEEPPVLDGALVSFLCRCVEARPVATHLVVIGEVLRVDLGAGAAGLVYKDRAYHAL